MYIRNQPIPVKCEEHQKVEEKSGRADLNPVRDEILITNRGDYWGKEKS